MTCIEHFNKTLKMTSELFFSHSSKASYLYIKNNSKRQSMYHHIAIFLILVLRSNDIPGLPHHPTTNCLYSFVKIPVNCLRYTKRTVVPSLSITITKFWTMRI